MESFSPAVSALAPLQHDRAGHLPQASNSSLIPALPGPLRRRRRIFLLNTRITAAQMLLARSSVLYVLAATARPRVQPLLRTARHRTDSRLSLPTPPPLSNLETSKDAAAARDWLVRFRGCPIPRAAVDIAFSRSSGPGGQVCPRSCLFSVRNERVIANRTSIK